MTLISVGVSSSSSAEKSPDQSVDEASVPTGSVYCKDGSDDDFADSVWESPTDLLVVHEDVEIAQDKEVGTDTDEDAFSDWLQSYPESGPAEAAVDLVSVCESDSVPSSLCCGNYNDIPQRPCRPMVPTAIGCHDSPNIPIPYRPSDEVSVPTSPSSITSYASNLPSSTPVFSQSADGFSSPTIRSVREDDGVTDVALSIEVSTCGVGEHALVTRPSSSFEYNTGEDSKESYSAVQSNPVLAGSDSDDECEVLAALASPRVCMTTDCCRTRWGKKAKLH